MQIKPKYRHLSLAELEDLRPEFVLFLASQGISADLWETYKQEQSDRVMEITVQFSNMILDKVYQSTQLVEKVSKHHWLLFHFSEKEVRLRGLGVLDKDLDLTIWSQEKIITSIQDGSLKVEIIADQKKLPSDKAQFVHQLISQGAVISENMVVFKAFNTLFDQI